MCVHENSGCLAELMARCDIGIISAGSTLMEMCRLGRPSLTVAHNEAEERFARHFHEHGATYFLGPASQVGVDEVALTLRALIDDPARRVAMGERGRHLIDGRGAERTAALVLERFCTGRDG